MILLLHHLHVAIVCVLCWTVIGAFETKKNDAKKRKGIRNVVQLVRKTGPQQAAGGDRKTAVTV